MTDKPESGIPERGSDYYTDEHIIEMVRTRPKYFDGKYVLSLLEEFMTLGVGGIPDHIREELAGQWAEQEELEDYRIYAKAAAQEGFIEVDDGAPVSIGDDEVPSGAYVQAWLWVENPGFDAEAADNEAG